MEVYTKHVWMFCFFTKAKNHEKKKGLVCVRGTNGDISRMSFSENKSCVCQKRE